MTTSLISTDQQRGAYKKVVETLRTNSEKHLNTATAIELMASRAYSDLWHIHLEYRMFSLVAEVLSILFRSVARLSDIDVVSFSAFEIEFAARFINDDGSADEWDLVDEDSNDDYRSNAVKNSYINHAKNEHRFESYRVMALAEDSVDMSDIATWERKLVDLGPEKIDEHHKLFDFGAAYASRYAETMVSSAVSLLAVPLAVALVRLRWMLLPQVISANDLRVTGVNVNGDPTYGIDGKRLFMAHIDDLWIKRGDAIAI